MTPRRLTWLVLGLVAMALVVGGVALLTGRASRLHREKVAAISAATNSQLEENRRAEQARAEAERRAHVEAQREAARLEDLARDAAAGTNAGAQATGTGAGAGPSVAGGAPNDSSFGGPGDPFEPNEANLTNATQPTPTPLPSATPAVGATLILEVTDQLEHALADCVVEVATDPDDAATPNKLILNSSTSPEGRFVATGLPPARYLLRVRTPLAWLEKAEQTRTVELAEGQTATERFVFEANDSLPVVVLDAEDKPIAGASVVATVAGAVREPVDTDSDGRAVVAAVPHGAAIDKLTVLHPEFTSQTRSGLTALDGTQTFRLLRRGELTLRVVWAADDSPVTSYTYRLLRRNEGGLFGLTPASRAIDVTSDDGTAVLNRDRDLDVAQWRVEVVVSQGPGQPVALRGSATFAITPQGQPADVRVAIGGGSNLAGRVVADAAGGEGVAGATVELQPPHQAFGTLVDDGRFLPAPVVTDDGGAFVFANMPVGSYALVAKRGAQRTAAPVDVEIREGAAPPFVELVLASGGAVYGVATGPGRLPIAGATVSLRVQRPNADGWEDGPSATTNEAGEYRVEGVPAGAHYVGLRLAEPIEDIGSVPWQVVNIAAGEQTRHDFDLSGDVTVRGRLTLAGQSVEGRIQHIKFANTSVQSGWALLDPNGNYEVIVAPGRYTLRTAGALVLHGESGGHVVADAPAEQTLDIDLPIVATDVVLVFPDNLPVSRGQVVLMPVDPGTRYNIPRLKFEQENRHVATLIAGRYQATFTSFDKQWRGDTDWTDVGPNAARELIIDVYRTVDGVRIGGWASGELSNSQWRTLTFDITEAVTGASGTASVLASYEKGRHAVELRSARLLANGRVLAQDSHAGWTGSDHWGNRFRLPLGKAEAGTRYAVEIDLKPDGGNDTTGSVYLSVR